jgi:hypothetical protein
MPPDAASHPYPHHPPVVRRNFICHCFEGGLYMGGAAFLQPETVMPKMVEQLGGHSAIIAIMPAILPAAFAMAGLFVAPVVAPYCRLLGLYKHSFGAIEDFVFDEVEPVDELTVQPVAQGLSPQAPALAWPIQPVPWVRKNSFLAKYPSGKQHGALDMGKAGDVVLAAAAGRSPAGAEEPRLVPQ